MTVLKQFKTSLVGALFLVCIVVVGSIATWRLCVEVMTFPPGTVALSFTLSPSQRVRKFLKERHLTANPDAQFDAYQLIREHTAAGNKVYFLREFDVLSFISFYRLMTLLYPRELFPIRELGEGWTPPDRRDGQAVFVLDFTSGLPSRLPSDPRLKSIAQQGSCAIWAYTDIE